MPILIEIEIKSINEPIDNVDRSNNFRLSIA